MIQWDQETRWLRALAQQAEQVGVGGTVRISSSFRKDLLITIAEFEKAKQEFEALQAENQDLKKKLAAFDAAKQPNPRTGKPDLEID